MSFCVFLRLLLLPEFFSLRCPETLNQESILRKDDGRDYSTFNAIFKVARKFIKTYIARINFVFTPSVLYCDRYISADAGLYYFILFVHFTVAAPYLERPKVAHQ